jgi:hypothetical protein
MTDRVVAAQYGSIGPKMGRLLACVALTCSVAACGNNFDLGSNDAGVPYDADCKPGTYSGTYLCTSMTSVVLPGVSAVPGTGTITLTLVPNGAHTLALTPDAALKTTTSGTTFIEPLTAALDCPTRQLDGATQGVLIMASGFSGMVTGKGTLTAIYNADASPPELDNGTLVPPPMLSTTCTWSAKLE